MREWKLAKECVRRLTDGQDYSLSELGRILGKTDTRINIARETLFVKMIEENILELIESSSWKTKKKKSEDRYMYDRDKMIISIGKFWNDELMPVIGSKFGRIYG